MADGGGPLASPAPQSRRPPPPNQQGGGGGSVADQLVAAWRRQKDPNSGAGGGPAAGSGNARTAMGRGGGPGRFSRRNGDTPSSTTTTGTTGQFMQPPPPPPTTSSSSTTSTPQQLQQRHSAAPNLGGGGGSTQGQGQGGYYQQNSNAGGGGGYGPRKHTSAPVPPHPQFHPHHPHPHPHQHPHHPHHPQSHRHRDQLEKVYNESRYDAEFDRGLGAGARAGPSGTQGGSIIPSSSNSQQPSTSRALFNPDSNIQSSQVWKATDSRRPPPPPPSSGPSRDREREPREREDSASRKSSSKSKRDPVDPNDMGSRGGGKESKDSLESEEGGAATGGNEGNGQTNSGKPSSRSSKESKNRRRREERRRGEQGLQEGENTSGGPPPAASRQLFDPKKDDPVKFHSGSNTATAGGGGTSRARSIAPSITSFASSAAVSLASQSDISGAGGGGGEDRDSSRREEANSLVEQLRKAYREIQQLEQKLQEENRAANVAQQNEDDHISGLRIQGGSKKYDESYWVKLTMTHKKLAEAHYSFLQMSLDPRTPASLNSLPTKYSIPTRLWQIGIYQLLERMRHSITSPQVSQSDMSPADLLDHLTEFIQYAYGHYTQLYEDPAVGPPFRAAWIEQLGDLARYRMAVAALTSRVAAQQHSSSRSYGDRLFDEGSPEREERVKRPLDAASIGDAALNDWELEESEPWRDSAREWYALGVTETPGTGRLQHHLALLSKGDELRSLYHYAKSLTAARPYPSARESILPLFEDEHQARRTAPDVTKAELFVHLHGMLFTKIALDDFDECLERFIERLKEEASLAKQNGGDWAALGSGAAAPFGDAEWFMIGVINISALVQYGAEDGILKKITTKPSAAPQSRSAPSTVASAKTKTPQAIMLNPSSLRRGETVHDDDDGDSSIMGSEANGDVVMRLSADTTSTEEAPLPFRLAQRLTFAILDLVLQHPTRDVNDSKVVNPYITLILTFLGTMAQYHAALRHLERAVPWDRLVTFFNQIPSYVEIKGDAAFKLLGGPLPEDWCIRGMDWTTTRHLFGRGYWKTKSSSRRDDMPPIGPPAATAQPESEMAALAFTLDGLDEFQDDDGSMVAMSAQLASARWRRVATLATWLTRTIPGLDFDATPVNDACPFTILGNLDAKLRRWKKEDEDTAEAERQSRITSWVGEDEDVEEDLTEESEDEGDNEDDSPALRDLKARRRELKAIIKQAREATSTARPSAVRSVSSSKRKGQNGQPKLAIFPGYTVLVFDTNILLSSMKLLRSLVSAEKWTIVIPLAVVTELDGLRHNDAPLGTAAVEAISYLEDAIRTFARYLKVQTSRGNYLRDLSIRSEAIDFGGNGADLDGVQPFSHDFARSMDDVILRAVAWQKDHFVSRLALVNPQADRRQVPADASPVVLVTFDRNLRLKARARGLDALEETGMASILEQG